MSSQDFKKRYGPWAFIAGASEGIGQAYAHLLAERGMNIITCARRIEPLEKDAQKLREKFGVEVKPVAMDLSAPDLANQFAQAIAGHDIGLLIYNACHSVIDTFVNTKLADHQRTLDVNCRGPLILTQAIAPQLLARAQVGKTHGKGGGILLMSSMSGFQGSAMVSTYAATKAFNTILAEGLWSELQPKGVDVLACVAGATLTPGFENNTPQEKQKQVFPMTAEAVARAGLNGLGRSKPVVIAGGMNRFVNAFSAFMTLRQRTQFFSDQTQKVYLKN